MCPFCNNSIMLQSNMWLSQHAQVRCKIVETLCWLFPWRNRDWVSRMSVLASSFTRNYDFLSVLRIVILTWLPLRVIVPYKKYIELQPFFPLNWLATLDLPFQEPHSLFIQIDRMQSVHKILWDKIVEIKAIKIL